MITKVSDVKQLVKIGTSNPEKVFPTIRKMAKSGDWKVREVAATALSEVSKKKAGEVVREMLKWADDPDENSRRTASESLRDIARNAPNRVLPVIEKLRADESPYVRKSVANVLRNVSKRNPDFASICAGDGQSPATTTRTGSSKMG